MQNAAAVVFQGEAKWEWPSCSVAPLLGPFAALVDDLSGKALAPPIVTLYCLHHSSSVCKTAFFIRSLITCAYPLFGLVCHHTICWSPNGNNSPEQQMRILIVKLALWYMKRHTGNVA